ncbi:PREDICTED: WAP four-disulfide core domain protein 6A-like [Condylura cristata]|uniref:WAP four-disulfide core domain protein 6A-like n=1 Tax=Condylura cristata TaxID=143302 RepID=UPI00064360A5|nr:PREDICTED: WAP four-disulfide core domain protein 6A-like [Condylura cristata]
MQLPGLLSVLAPFFLLGGVWDTGLVEGFFRSPCPKIQVNCKYKERSQCQKSRECPGKMKCCDFNCGKKCLNLSQDLCSLPEAAGPCLAYIPRWWYDKEKDVCSRFIYGGCQGNSNSFQSEAICQDICQKR